MQDIFNRKTEFGQGNFVTADAMVLKVMSGGATEKEYLVQQVAIQFNQPLNRIYEIGSPFVYFAPGRPVGTCQLGRIVGAHSITKVLGPEATGVWTTEGEVGEKVMKFFKKGSGAGYALSYIMTGAVCESYAVATDANGLLLQENVSLQYASLSFGT
jgi:hypothetical protein